MKKSTLTIRPKAEDLQSTANLVLSTSYDIVSDKGSQLKRVLTDSLEVLEVPRDKDVKKLYVDMIHKNNFEYTIDLDRPGLNTDLICKFFDEHPHASDITERRSSDYDKPDSMYYYILSDEIIDSRIEDDAEIVETYLRFKSLNRQEKDAVSVYFGVAPWDMDEKELLTTMISLEDGVLTASRDNRSDFKEHIELMYDSHTINLKAAVISGALKSDGQAFIISGQVIGNNFNESLATLRVREDLYNQMLNDMKYMNVPVFRGISDSTSADESSKRGKKTLAPEIPKGKFAEA
jgi:hypothetical protein